MIHTIEHKKYKHQNDHSHDHISAKNGANKKFYSHTGPVKIMKVAWMLQDGCIIGNCTIPWAAHSQVTVGLCRIFS